MDLGALSAVATYAYLQAGGGRAGALAALPAIQTTGGEASALVASAGSPEAAGGLQGGQDTTLTAGTYALQAQAGQGQQALEALLNPPLGFANPFTSQTGLDSGVAPAYAAYQYAQAQAAGQAASYLASLGTAVRMAAQAGLVNLMTPTKATAAPAEEKAATPTRANTAFTAGPMDANGDGLVSPAERGAYAFNHPALSPMDRDLNGTVSASERLAYALSHPELDPKDANLDGYVSPAEARAYALAHPAARAGAGGIDLLA